MTRFVYVLPAGRLRWEVRVDDSTPRVAHSLDDLRVGQLVAWKWGDDRPEDGWSLHKVHEKIQPDAEGKSCDGFWTADGGLIDTATFHPDSPQALVILDDAEAEPTESAGQFYRLKRDALIAARAIAIVVGGEVQPHDRRGRIQDPDSYGPDPRESHG